MTETPFPVVVITGPIGVGKTRTAQALGDLLETHGVARTVIDMDWMRDTWPQPADDRFNTRLGYRNLADTVRNSREAGSGRAVLADVVESREQRACYRDAIPDAEVHVVRLTADMEAIRQRIAHRASGVDETWELERTAELASIMDAGKVGDVVIDTTGRTPDDVAREIAVWLGWLPDTLETTNS